MNKQGGEKRRRKISKLLKMYALYSDLILHDMGGWKQYRRELRDDFGVDTDKDYPKSENDFIGIFREEERDRIKKEPSERIYKLAKEIKGKGPVDLSACVSGIIKYLDENHAKTK